jgi:hypothetical protein
MALSCFAMDISRKSLSYFRSELHASRRDELLANAVNLNAQG